MANFETPSYYITDNQSASNSVIAALMKADENENLKLSTSMNQIDVNNTAFLDATGDRFQDALNQEIRSYIDNTISLSFQNELYNTNMYMNTSMTSQEEQIGEMSQKARNHIMKYRQKFQLKLYDIKYYIFIRIVLTYGIFVVGISGILLAFAYKQEPAMLKSNIAWITIGVLTLVYLIMVFFYIRNNSSRKKTDWDKYYFSGTGVEKKNNCSA